MRPLPASPVAPRRGSAPRIRAADEDRARVTSRLADHYAEGRLDYAELDDRTSRALAAVHLDELDNLLADLPESGPVRLPGSRPARSSSTRRPASAVPRFPRQVTLLVLVVMLVVVTRGAALWLLPLLWWAGGPRRLGPRPAHWAAPRRLAAPPGGRAGPAPCRHWSAV